MTTKKQPTESTELKADVYTAIFALQGEIVKIKKDANNPLFNSRYLTYDTLQAVLRPVLQSHGLILFQKNQSYLLEGKFPVMKLETIVRHVESGTEISTISEFPIPRDRKKDGTDLGYNPQKLGIMTSYMCRYAICPLFGIAASEDDDANSYVPQAPEPKEPEVKKEGLEVQGIEYFFAYDISALIDTPKYGELLDHLDKCNNKSPVLHRANIVLSVLEIKKLAKREVTFDYVVNESGLLIES